MAKVALVTGGSSGIGRCVAAGLAEKGCQVYEFSRRESSQPGITHISVDITDRAGVKAAVEQVLQAEGRLDILVCNAGFGISGAVEFTEPEEAKRQMDVNFFGMVNTVHAALPALRESCGRIVCTSSVAALTPLPFQAYYSASKAAINSFAMALANEVRALGVSVCAVMPGDIKTGFTDARKKCHQGDDIYGGRIARSVSVMEKDERSGMAAERAGAFICKIALKERVKPLYAIGAKYSFFTVLARILPPAAANGILRMMYAK